MSRELNVKVGDKARDKVSGFTGTVTCKKVHLFGNIQFILENYSNKGDAVSDAIAFDWQQLELVTPERLPATECPVSDEIELGDRVKDRISGYEGIVTATWYWLNGCVELVVETGKDGASNGERNAIQRYEVTKKAAIKPDIANKKTKRPGGPSQRIKRDSIR